MKKVMVVDDSMIIRINLKKIFEKQGYEVVAEAANGKDAVDKYLTCRPDLVTMDITMPILDGITAMQQINMLDKQASVIMVSALGQELKIIEALNAGAKQYIVKPFKETDVIRAVESVLCSPIEGERT